MSKIYLEELEDVNINYKKARLVETENFEKLYKVCTFYVFYRYKRNLSRCLMQHIYIFNTNNNLHSTFFIQLTHVSLCLPIT